LLAGAAAVSTTADVIRASGLLTLGDHPAPDAIEKVLGNLRAAVDGADPIRREAVRAEAVKALKRYGWRARAISDVLDPPKPSSGGADDGVTFVDVEPADDVVAGSELLNDLATWLRRYIWMSDASRDALAVWCVLTWFRGIVYFAPILALLSATKRCAKTALLDLLRTVVYRGYLTSGMGATAAVIFRLNEQRNPTFLIDEAEKLSGAMADREIIGLLNAGYRRGARVQRCSPDSHEIQEFDAFGFRALAAIGSLWDTILDRSLVVHMERRPRDIELERFNARQIEQEGAALAGRIARWVQDNVDDMAAAEAAAPRPTWLNDRACDNWSGLFAVAALAGGKWPERIAAVAKELAADDPDGDGDRGERLLRDIYEVVTSRPGIILKAGSEEIIKSGDLVTALNELDSSPWADDRKGSGISPHRLASLLKPFKVRPRQSKDKSVRGYVVKDFKRQWKRYEVSGVSKSNNDNNLDENEVSGGVDTSKYANSLSGNELDTPDTLKQGEGDAEIFDDLEEEFYELLEREAIQAEADL
jgi:hypothetical protein